MSLRLLSERQAKKAGTQQPRRKVTVKNMKLFISGGDCQPDPYVIEHGGKFYMYATHENGVQLYTGEDMLHFEYRGFCFSSPEEHAYWAPAVIYYGGSFWLYYSSMPAGSRNAHTEQIRVAVSDRPEGPFRLVKNLTVPFSIDPHVVKSGGELYIFYSVNDFESKRAGTLIVVDKMLSPTETACSPRVCVRATLDEEIFMRDRFFAGQNWHTIEGAFYFRDGDTHYLMYSGNCYENENYFVGYAVAEGHTDDLTKLDFVKFPDGGKTYSPLLRKNEQEEGTGHNSVLFTGGKYHMYYHARDIGASGRGDLRTARIRTVIPHGGILTLAD